MDTTNSKKRLDPDDNVLSLFKTEILIQLIKGEYDLNYLCRVELAIRGFNLEGKWVGFNKSKQILNVE